MTTYTTTQLANIQNLDFLTEYELEKRFNDFLDDCYEDIDICGLTYSPSKALKSVDPIAYRESLLNYLNAELEETLTEIDGIYFHTQDIEDILDSEEGA